MMMRKGAVFSVVVQELDTQRKGVNEMHLDYPMTKNGLFILETADYEDIAQWVLSEYQPQVLRKPQPLNVEHLMKECLYLDLKSERLSEDGEIWGLIVFSDIVYTGIGKNDEPYQIEVPEGTVLLEQSLDKPENTGIKRFTQAHEASHWICHRTYHAWDHRPYEFCRQIKCPVIACRAARAELAGEKDRHKWTDEVWKEWQANNLAAALLMPKDTFLLAFYDVMRRQSIYGDILLRKHGRARVTAVVDEMKQIFQVPGKAVELRLVRFNLLEEEIYEE
ncbi:MAG: ImmA/IrrE family metallo-endopeptidase [Lachnospiraceae bacterium]|nr:ImmA/IrrE family metallo-endopeptidase [Lachnospiraceae bacterium]